MAKKQKKLAVIGGGQMGRALVGGMLDGKLLAPEQLCLVEPAPESQAWWREHHPDIEHSELIAAVEMSEATMLAIKPPVIPKVVEAASGSWSGTLVISIAAGVGLENLCRLIGHERVVRVMPNTPSLVGQGASAYCCASEVTSDERVWIQKALESVGIAVEVDDSQMDAVTGLSGSGPAYVSMVVEAMADGGVLAGLPRPLAMKLATQTVLGTATMIAETGRHPGELKDAVASPGGTTIVAIAALEQNGMRGALIEAVTASANRSRELGRQQE